MNTWYIPWYTTRKLRITIIYVVYAGRGPYHRVGGGYTPKHGREALTSPEGRTLPQINMTAGQPSPPTTPSPPPDDDDRLHKDSSAR